MTCELVSGLKKELALISCCLSNRLLRDLDVNFTIELQYRSLVHLMREKQPQESERCVTIASLDKRNCAKS